MRGCLQMAKESYGTSIDHQLWVFFSFPHKFSAPPHIFHDFPRIVVAIVLSTCCFIAVLMGIAFFVWHSMRRCHAESLEGGDRCGFWLAFLGEIPEVWMLGKASWWKYQMVNDSKKKIRRFGSRILGWVYNNESDDYRIQLSWVTLDCWSNSPAGMTGHRHARHHQAS